MTKNQKTIHQRFDLTVLINIEPKVGRG
ncbi:uncharacterized protein METZ01_LOCUS101957 [marine metagenome]|uniref:Uncharacterized protein n=1 Tax=marine metagenome TaxID=408172 RepID=A0A381WAZ2_9ZZZZ